MNVDSGGHSICLQLHYLFSKNVTKVTESSWHPSGLVTQV